MVCLEAKVSLTALILAGGKGTRMRPFNAPKCLVTLRERTILSMIVSQLATYCEKMIVCAGYKTEMVEDEISKPEYSGRNISIDCAGVDASMLDRVNHAIPLIQDKALLVYADTWADVNIRSLITDHGSNYRWATMTLYPIKLQFGIVRQDTSNCAFEFLEKPVIGEWFNIGYTILEPQAMMMAEGASDMVDYWRHLTASRQLYCYRHKGKHVTVNTEHEREEAEEILGDWK